jgi:hypothetical protein
LFAPIVSVALKLRMFRFPASEPKWSLWLPLAFARLTEAGLPAVLALLTWLWAGVSSTTLSVTAEVAGI